MKKLLATGLAAVATLGMGMGVAGADTVTVSVVPGSMSASSTDLQLSPLAQTFQAQGVIGEITITATDGTAGTKGWTVNLQASNFEGPTPIGSENLEIFYIDQPVHVGGQAIDPVGGPKVPGFSSLGSLEEGRNVMTAADGFGKGIYSEKVGLQLTVPAEATIGVYTTELTVSITAAP